MSKNISYVELYLELPRVFLQSILIGKTVAEGDVSERNDRISR
jgi:hypothetical protein